MKKILSGLLALSLLWSCSEAVVDTFGNIGGTVSDAQTNAPLSGVTVVLSPTGYSQVTRDNGSFQFDNLDVQEYTLTFTRVGYEPTQHKVTVKPGLSSSVQISMHVADVSKPTVIIGSATNMTSSSIRLHATLTSTGNSAVTQHGFCYAEHTVPTLADKVINLGTITSTGAFSSDVTDLAPGHTYYCRAFAQNGAGQVFSDELTFTTPEKNQGGGNDIAVPQGLILYYTFDNEDVSDLTEMEMDAQNINGATFISNTPNGSGKALFINGNKEQALNIPKNVFSGLTHFSFATWIMDFSAGSLFAGVVPEKGIGYQRPVLYADNDGKFIGSVCTNTDPTFSYVYTPIQSSRWHHIVWTVSSSSDTATLSLYVDGKLVDTTADRFYLPEGIKKVQIGGNADGRFNVFLTAKVDNIRFYSRTLTSNDIASIYEAEK